MAKARFDITTIEIPEVAKRPLYAGVGATDLAVGYVRDYVADVQKRFADVQKSVAGIDLEPKALRDQAVVAVSTRVDALSKDAKARRAAVEARVAELQGEALAFPTRVQGAVTENVVVVSDRYADLAKRGEQLLARIRRQEATQATAASAKTTVTKAKTTRTQTAKATDQTAKATSQTAKATAKKTTTTAKRTAKKTSTTPRSSAKATGTAAKKTASNATKATTAAAKKVGD
ncbi:hypothetical protein [Nocardioides sp. SYSU DS0663]|uniref:hypothetical protein n=1 Tax=Nocardioides sp. SYSU DS0663 TaxID=3416445 RepID=UPI003F4C7DA8